MNKQRITLLTKAEKRAAITGGALDDRVPEDAIRRRIANEGSRAFDMDVVIREVRREVGYARMGPPRLAAAEIVSQADDTIAVIEELDARLRNMHPELECWANDVLFPARGEFLYQLNERAMPDLYRVKAALSHARGVVNGQARKTGPKPSAYATARDRIAQVLCANSTPSMPKRAARAVAVEVLSLCKLNSPRR